MYSQTNDDISGVWLRYDHKMKDGSEILFSGDPQKYHTITFNENEMWFNGNPVATEKHPFGYTRNGNNITTSATSGYTIEKLSKDTLVLCERIDGFTPDKLKCYYLKNANTIFEELADQYKNEDTLMAQPNYSPKLEKELPILTAIGLRNVGNENMIGNLIIDLESSNISVEVIEATMKRKRQDVVIELMESSYDQWGLEDFRHFKKIKIPFVLETISVRNGNNAFATAYMNFFTHNLRKVNKSLPSYSEVLLSDDYYEKALKAFDAQKYEKAAKLFAKTYEMNPKTSIADIIRLLLCMKMENPMKLVKFGKI